MRRKLISTAACALVLALLFAAVYTRVASFVVEQQKAELDAKWSAVKGYLHFETCGADWFFDAYDPEESYIVNRLQHIFFLADSNGRPLQFSDVYKHVGLPNPAEVRRQMRSLRDAEALYRRADSTFLCRRRASAHCSLVRARGLVCAASNRSKPAMIVYLREEEIA